MKSFRDQLIDFLHYYKENPSTISDEEYVDYYLNEMKLKEKKEKRIITEDMFLSLVVRKFDIKHLKAAFDAGKTENDFVSWFDKFNREHDLDEK
jgi:NAD-dependent DNA ligase